MSVKICLQFLKFSHASGVRSDNSVPWEHIIADDLYITVDGEEAKGQLQMRIIQRNSVLESLDVGSYIDCAIQEDHRLRQAGIEAAMEQLPIFGMRKGVLLALRYRQSNGQSRRLQLRMRDDDECNQIHRIFERRGMRVSDQSARAARPDTRGSDHRPSTAHADTRAIANHYECTGTARSSPFNVPPLEAGTFSQRHSPTHAQQRDGGGQLQTVAIQAGGNVRSRFFTAPQHAALPTEPPLPTLGQPCHTFDKPPQLPATSILFGKENGVVTTARQAAQGKLATDYEEQSSVTFGRSSHQTSPQPPSSGLLSYTTAPSPLPPNLEQVIPPRRELPFKRPDSTRSSSSRPCSSALELPPLPRPKTAKLSTVSKSDLSAKYDRVVGRPSTASPSKKAWEGGLSNTSPNADPQSSSPCRAQLPVAPKPNPMVGVLGQKRPLAELSPNAKARRLNSLADAPHEVVDSPSLAKTRPPLPPAQHTAAAMRSTTTARPTMDENAALAAYAAQTLEDRSAALDEFMVSKLEDPSFTTLCQDVEACWRRIALGL